MINKILEEEYNLIYSGLVLELNKLKNRNILITGATGLVGSYLVDFLDYLNKNYNLGIKIYAMARSRERLINKFGEENLNLIYLEQDLNLPIKDSSLKYDYIIHAASNAHPVAYSTDPVGTMKTNLLGTMNLLELLRISQGKFLYISTGEIYGNNTDHAFKEEDLGVVDTKQVRACYPESKRAAETLCMAYAAQYGINLNVARLCYVYGATITDTNSRADAQFLRNALDKKDIVMKSEGTQKRTYCYVADVLSGLLCILLKGQNNEVYNVSNPNSIVSIKEYAQTLADIAGVQLKFELPDEIEARGFSKPLDSILDSTKLQNIGWRPIYDIKSGLTNTVKQLLLRES